MEESKMSQDTTTYRQSMGKWVENRKLCISEVWEAVHLNPASLCKQSCTPARRVSLNLAPPVPIHSARIVTNPKGKCSPSFTCDSSCSWGISSTVIAPPPSNHSSVFLSYFLDNHFKLSIAILDTITSKIVSVVITCNTYKFTFKSPCNIEANNASNASNVLNKNNASNALIITSNASNVLNNASNVLNKKLKVLR